MKVEGDITQRLVCLIHFRPQRQEKKQLKTISCQHFSFHLQQMI